MDFGFILSKLLPLFIYPLGLCVVLGFIGLLLVVFGWRRCGFLGVFLGLAILAVASTAPFSEALLNPLERMYEITTPDQAAVADAIVVLGGTVGVRRYPRVVPELRYGGQRLLHGARLYRASRAPLLILSGGSAFDSDSVQQNADASLQIMVELGVPESAITVENNSRNTYENAVETARVLKEKGLRRILLVTSASHMPRAMAAFRSQNIDSLAQPTQIVSVDTEIPMIVRLTPNAEYLYHTQLAIKEYLGFFVYRWRGWISDDYDFKPGRVDQS